MKRIVCYGDSNTWGYDVLTDGRFGSERWTRALSSLLGEGYEVIEEGLCGRTTVFEDPLNEGLSGIRYLTPCLQSHSPFDTLAVMLGTNDCKERFSLTAKNIADGMKALALKARQLEVWTGAPDILIIAPAPMRKECERAVFAGEMGRCSEKSYELAKEYRTVAELTGSRFLDASAAPVSDVDYMHLSVSGHRWLAERVSELVR